MTKRSRVKVSYEGRRVVYDFGDVLVEIDETFWHAHREARQIRSDRVCGGCGQTVAKGDIAIVDWEGYAPTAEDTSYQHPECVEAHQRQYPFTLGHQSVTVVRS